MTKEKRSKILTAVVVVILCAIFVGGFAIGLNSVLAMEGSYPPNVLVETPVPENNEDAVKFLDDAIDLAVAEAPKISVDRDLDIAHDGSAYSDYIVETDGSEQFTETVKYIISEIDNDGSALYKTMLGKFESKSADFGEGIDDIIKIPELKSSDVKDYEIDYIYYHCSSCGEDSTEPLDKCELCGSDLPYQMKYKDEYTVTLHFDPSKTEILNKNFDPVNTDDVKEMFAEALGNNVAISDIKLSYSDISVTYKIRRFTSEISFLSYNKVIDVDANITLNEKFAELNEHNIKFTVESNDKYKFTWPSLVLSDDTIDVDLKGNDNLLATLTCSDPTAQEVKWESSDESIVTVDEEGYFKAGKEAGVAEITATFEYNGKTYSDTCVINVKKSVESMKMLKKNINIGIGENYILKTQVSPKKATIQTVTWYTEDDSIATVDENGVVTGVAEGSVIVYALSDDGYFKSSCEVTVK